MQGIAARHLLAAAAELADGIVATQRRVVICQLDDPPAHTMLLEHLVQELADAARLLWPDWYGPHVRLSEESATTRVTTDSNLQALLAANIRVDAAWFRKASLLANRSRLPIVADTSVTRQVRELAACLGSEEICIIITVTLPEADRDRLHNIVKATEWLAREADAPVVVVTSPQLVPDGCPIPFPLVPESPGNTPPATEECPQRLLPFEGRPHPHSPGEQLLAAALAADHELTGLFGFNEPVTAKSERRFIVDLLWRHGKVIVEVDGYRDHSRPDMFCKDRQRDYELLISDYVVLRIPHTEIVNNIEPVLQKIRQVVRWRQKESQRD